MPEIISLNGKWKFTQLTESTLEKHSVAVKKPESRNIQVPANWYLQGENFAGEALYEREFQAPLLMQGQAAFLRFKGADYFLKAELNGSPLGKHEGYFQSFEFTATKALREKNRLKVWVESPKENSKVWPHEKYLIKGIFNHHDARPGSWDTEHGQDYNTGGLWNGVELLTADRLFLERIQVTPKLLPNHRALVSLKLILVNVGQAGAYDVEVAIHGEKFPGRWLIRKKVHLPRGRSQVRLEQVIPKPRLWWTWDQGEPNLYKASIALRGSKDGKVVERGEVRFGIREVKVSSRWEFFLNGRKFFPRGTNIIPAQWLSEYNQERADRDVKMMKEAGLNAVRVHAHVNREEFYKACDEAGLFVWQDFALQWSYERTESFTRNACRQIKDMVRQLYNHPSILVWCCHNEPSVNRDELDPILARAVREEDSSRHVDTASDFQYHPYPGWYWEDSILRDVKPGAVGADAPFYSEFGAQALPSVKTLRKMFKPVELWPPDFKKWAFHDFQYFQTFNVARIEMGKSIGEFVNNSQRYQARLVKDYIQSIRLKKYQPMNGYFHFMFVDCWPAITWSVVDYFRNPKEAYRALQTASQPLLPLWRPHVNRFNPGDVLFWGKSLLRELVLINDFGKPIKGLRVEARVMDSRSRVIFREKRICGVKADCVAKPFDTPDRFNHQEGFHLPLKGPLGVYRAEFKVRNRTGNLIAHNEREFEVVEKIH